MRFVVAAIILSLVGLEASKRRLEHAEELSQYWDAVFQGKNPPLGNIDPEMAKVVQMLKLYQDQIS